MTNQPPPAKFSINLKRTNSRKLQGTIRYGNQDVLIIDQKDWSNLKFYDTICTILNNSIHGQVQQTGDSDMGSDNSGQPDGLGDDNN